MGLYRWAATYVLAHLVGMFAGHEPFSVRHGTWAHAQVEGWLHQVVDAGVNRPVHGQTLLRFSGKCCEWHA